MARLPASTVRLFPLLLVSLLAGSNCQVASCLTQAAEFHIETVSALLVEEATGSKLVDTSASAPTKSVNCKLAPTDNAQNPTVCSNSGTSAKHTSAVLHHNAVDKGQLLGSNGENPESFQLQAEGDMTTHSEEAECGSDFLGKQSKLHKPKSQVHSNLKACSFGALRSKVLSWAHHFVSGTVGTMSGVLVRLPNMKNLAGLAAIGGHLKSATVSIVQEWSAKAGSVFADTFGNIPDAYLPFLALVLLAQLYSLAVVLRYILKATVVTLKAGVTVVRFLLVRVIGSAVVTICSTVTRGVKRLGRLTASVIQLSSRLLHLVAHGIATCVSVTWRVLSQFLNRQINALRSVWASWGITKVDIGVQFPTESMVARDATTTELDDSADSIPNRLRENPRARARHERSRFDDESEDQERARIPEGGIGLGSGLPILRLDPPVGRRLGYEELPSGSGSAQVDDLETKRMKWQHKMAKGKEKTLFHML